MAPPDLPRDNWSSRGAEIASFRAYDGLLTGADSMPCCRSIATKLPIRWLPRCSLSVRRCPASAISVRSFGCSR